MSTATGSVIRPVQVTPIMSGTVIAPPPSWSSVLGFVELRVDDGLGGFLPVRVEDGAAGWLDVRVQQ